MGEPITLEKWIFLCPTHGEESSLFCFRAFDEKNADRWRKVQIISEEIKTTLEERQKHQEQFTLKGLEKHKYDIEYY